MTEKERMLRGELYVAHDEELKRDRLKARKLIIDICDATIGDHVFFGPRVGVYTAAHPIDAGVRNANLEYGKPITIGNSVWLERILSSIPA